MADLARTFSDLVRVETLLWNALDLRLRQTCDLTLARVETMQVLERVRPCRVTDIARELAIGWAGASKIVDRVEAAGHCRREANPGDGRSSHVSLTADGRAALARAEAAVADELHLRLGSALTPAQLTPLGATLDVLRRSLVDEP